MTNRTKSLHALVVAMAGDAIVFNQFLVKGDVLLLLCDRQTFGGYFANLFYFVAGDALRRWAADKRGVAGKAICRQFGMGINRLPRADHQLWRKYCQQHQSGQINSHYKHESFVFHFHSQNSKMLRIWVMPSTANARVIGKCTARHFFITSKVVASQNSFFSIASSDSPCCA